MWGGLRDFGRPCFLEGYGGIEVHRSLKGPQSLAPCAQIKIIDFGAACDLSTGVNFNPLYGMLDPRYAGELGTWCSGAQPVMQCHGWHVHRAPWLGGGTC